MLSYPDSERLKELGYGQELKEGDWVYFITYGTRGKPLKKEPTLDLCDANDDWWSDLEPDGYVKVPTTDGMIEGLRKAYSCFHTLSINIFDGGASVDFVLADPVSEFLSAKIIGFGDSVEQALCSVWKEQKG